MHSSILNETIASVTDILGRELGGIVVERAVIGLFFTGVKLTAGTAGTCATPRDAVPGDICCPVSARAVDFTRLARHPAAELMQHALAENGLSRAVGIATLNALAELCWRRRPAPGAELLFYRSADLAAETVPAADVLLVTGATLLNDTLEDLLALARPEARVTVLGPTVGMLPDAFLARGADVLGSVRITQPDAFLDLLAEGGSAPHFLGRSAEKIVLTRRVVETRARVA